MTLRRVVVLIVAVLAVALTVRLGVWQLDRAAQKVALQQALDRQRALPPLAADALARQPAELGAQLHRAVRLDGRWIAAATVALENRTMGGRAGFFVLTPLALDDGRAVLVQRGFVPRDAADRTRVAAPPAPEGRVSVFGRVAAGPSQFFELGPTAAASGVIRQNLDLSDYARETRLPLAPLLVVQEDEAGRPTPADGLSRQWPLPATDVDKHHGYAFQWFALAALVLGLYVWFQLLRPRFAARSAGAHRP